MFGAPVGGVQDPGGGARGAGSRTAAALVIGPERVPQTPLYGRIAIRQARQRLTAADSALLMLNFELCRAVAHLAIGRKIAQFVWSVTHIVGWICYPGSGSIPAPLLTLATSNLRGSCHSLPTAPAPHWSVSSLRSLPRRLPPQASSPVVSWRVPIPGRRYRPRAPR